MSSSLSKRSSQSPPDSTDLKQRIITCLNKLEDRDTLSLASTELESIAKSLPLDSFSSFITCIHNTDTSSKTHVRKQCVYLLTLLSHSHGNSLSTHLPKMISTVIRRLRDPDSTVRSSCVEAIASMSTQITKPPFSVFLKPLMETLTLEQDLNAQIGSALCLAAAVEAARDIDMLQLRKSLLKLGKLAKNDGFKAKAALLVLIGSVVSVGGASSRSVMDWLVPCVVGFLSNEDWAVRKAAAETLGKVAAAVAVVEEKGLVEEYKMLCISSLENRKFDKIKVVRETMNQTLELWKEIPDALSSSSPIGNGNGEDNLGRPLKKTVPTGTSSRSSLSPSPSLSGVSPVTNNRKGGSPRNKETSSTPISKLDCQKSSSWNIEIAVSDSPSSKFASKDNADGSDFDFQANATGGNGSSLLNSKRVLFNDMRDEKVNKFGNLRSGSRVVPFQDRENRDSDIMEETFGSHKDFEDISLIRDHLRQIENQQSSLLDLLQRFIGNSQSGMSSLEKRVHGLEMALDEISYDLGLSSGRVPNSGFAENSCCKLPGAEFLSSKFWRRAEGRYSGSKFCSTANVNGLPMHHTTDKDAIAAESLKQNSQRLRTQSRGELAVNPLADIDGSDLRENMGQYPRRLLKTAIHEDDLQICNVNTTD